jgi:hypothetical protein
MLCLLPLKIPFAKPPFNLRADFRIQAGTTVKAVSPMSVTLSGIVIDVRLEQPRKAYSATAITLAGMTPTLASRIGMEGIFQERSMVL